MPPGEFFPLFCRLLIFSKSTFLKNSFRNTIRVSNSLDPDQARHSVGPDLGPNCLQKLSAEDTRRYRVKRLPMSTHTGHTFLVRNKKNITIFG